MNVAESRYEINMGLLCRRTYDTINDEMMLKCCVPDVICGQVEVPGVGLKPITYRDKIMYEYHHGTLFGHMGRDRTIEMIERDFWWDGIYADVTTYCKRCPQCAASRGKPGVSAWKRTELYSAPFRVLQFDFVEVGDSDPKEGYNHILTCIYPFSRWVCP